MKFAKEAAAYFPEVEIIEIHHEDKKDAPSGTALATAKLISENRPAHETAPDSTESLPGPVAAITKELSSTRSACRATWPTNRSCLGAVAKP